MQYVAQPKDLAALVDCLERQLQIDPLLPLKSKTAIQELLTYDDPPPSLGCALSRANNCMRLCDL